MKIIWVDGYNRPEVAERLIASNLNWKNADKVLAAYRDGCHAKDWYIAVPDSHVLSRGTVAPSAATSPTHTDMMVDPGTLDAFMAANPLPADPDYKAIFYKLMGSLVLSDHMGDAANAMSMALELAGDPIKWDEMSDLCDVLGARGITTLYGTSLGSEGDKP